MFITGGGGTALGSTGLASMRNVAVKRQRDNGDCAVTNKAAKICPTASAENNSGCLLVCSGRWCCNHCKYIVGHWWQFRSKVGFFGRVAALC